MKYERGDFIQYGYRLYEPGDKIERHQGSIPARGFDKELLYKSFRVERKHIPDFGEVSLSGMSILFPPAIFENTDVGRVIYEDATVSELLPINQLIKEKLFRLNFGLFKLTNPTGKMTAFLTLPDNTTLKSNVGFYLGNNGSTHSGLGFNLDWSTDDGNDIELPLYIVDSPDMWAQLRWRFNLRQPFVQP